MSENSGQWVTIREAAEALGSPERTIRRWAGAGKLAADRSGAVILVDIAGHAQDGRPATTATVTDTDGQVATVTAAQIETLQVEIEGLRSERDALQAEAGELRAVLAEVRSERDYLRQVHALAVSGEPPLLTEGERPRRRWRWPWQRGEG